MTQREFILDRHVSSLVDVDSVLSSGTRRRREGNEGECGAAQDENQTRRTMLPMVLPTLLASDQTVIPVAGEIERRRRLRNDLREQGDHGNSTGGRCDDGTGMGRIELCG